MTTSEQRQALLCLRVCVCVFVIFLQSFSPLICTFPLQSAVNMDEERLITLQHPQWRSIPPQLAAADRLRSKRKKINPLRNHKSSKNNLSSPPASKLQTPNQSRIWCDTGCLFLQTLRLRTRLSLSKLPGEERVP